MAAVAGAVTQEFTKHGIKGMPDAVFADGNGQEKRGKSKKLSRAAFKQAIDGIPSAPDNWVTSRQLGKLLNKVSMDLEALLVSAALPESRQVRCACPDQQKTITCA